MGYDAHKMENFKIIENINGEKEFDIIFNTIPHNVIQEDFISKINNSIIIDLASYPYGMDNDLVNKYNVSYYREPSIPSRYAPQSAGEILGETIINILSQENLL